MKKNEKMSISKKLLAGALVFTFTLATGQKVYAVAYDPENGYKDLGVRFWENEKPSVDFYINATSKYIIKEVPEPTFGSTTGDWSVFSLSRGMYLGADYLNDIPADYFSNYIARIEHEVMTNKNLGRTKLTDYDRLIFSLTLLNYNVHSVSNKSEDFILKISENFNKIENQGINSPIWTLLAINSGDYSLYPSKPENNKNWNTEGKMIDSIIDKEIINGGWSLNNQEPDADITAMAIQGLAPYYLSEEKFNKTDSSHNYLDFKKAVERGIAKLADLQLPHGGFDSYNAANSESTSQAIVALTEIGINPKSTNVPLNAINKTVSFVTAGAVRDGVKTNNMVDALLTFWDNEKLNPEIGSAGFRHVTEGNDGGSGSGTTANGMASDQATYALVAYDRFMTGQARLQNLMDQKTTPYKSFKAKPVNLTYNINGISDVNPTSYLASSKIKADTNPPKGKIFKNWNSKQDGSGISYKAGDVLSMPKENITLYSQYDYQKYGLSLNANDGKITTSVPTTFTVDDTILLPTEETIQKDGFAFDGWYTTSDFKGNPIKQINKGTTESITLYAKWIGTDYLKVINSINNIGEVTLEKDNKIKEARADFDNLDKEQQNRVTNLNTLIAAEVKLKELFEAATEEEKINAAVKAVETSINEIGKVTLTSQNSIEKARKEYNGLGVNQNRVNPLLVQKLNDAEVTLSNLQISSVEQSIQAIGKEVTLASKFNIESARNNYNKLSDAQKPLVKNYKELEAAEIQLKKLEEEAAEEARIKALVTSAEDAIDAIGKVELYNDSETRIQFARLTFDNLEANVKARVNEEKINVLVKSENDYKELLLDRDERVKAVEASITAIGTVTADSASKIENARKLYDALQNPERPLVKNSGDLIKAEKELEIITKVKQVETLIDSIGTIASENREKIVKADIAFNDLGIYKERVSSTHKKALEMDKNSLKLADDIKKFDVSHINADSKSSIDNLNKRASVLSKHLSKDETSKLKTINSKLELARKNEEAQLKLATNLINSLVLGNKSKENQVTNGANHVGAVKKARIELDKVTSSYGKSLQDYHQSEMRLIEAEARVKAIEEVIAKIDTLPEISQLKAKDAKLVNEINDLFNQLTKVEQNEVTNKQVLIDAKKQLSEVKGGTTPTRTGGNYGTRKPTSNNRRTPTKAVSKRKPLPKTGEVTQNYIVPLGTAMLGSLFFWRKKEEKDSLL
ncbi:InlB B-repeat-containing protein [Vagococcus carniphilus]|uniref:InlB B-repeat-containing protein n=1 Tax=Vagococcus carniphilus TaxID=218144 RepID=A0AAW8U5S1_9ENTE|nr:InlB B-repeat-containing protein [Vagococcus carniphilus]MDT2829708.1 InlB B-repeat-containing protein [Vagococcus carniphilus]MDT2834181.1 InlB B-repeat-containing protein [Vagococcus carniphilus]MDT2839167.1 InlB B-repeat-containing protein [Vagococcus carniphilus]MDT2853225.1 InlB B-repeat-containing protein [Vagococcus carniphilus]